MTYRCFEGAVVGCKVVSAYELGSRMMVNSRSNVDMRVQSKLAAEPESALEVEM